jgi:asparagine synthase (glutamine-hydrolysing)
MEIYNHQALRDGILKSTLLEQIRLRVIVHLYEFGYDFCNKLDGDFALVVINGDDFVQHEIR